MWGADGADLRTRSATPSKFQGFAGGLAQRSEPRETLFFVCSVKKGEDPGDKFPDVLGIRKALFCFLLDRRPGRALFLELFCMFGCWAW